MSTYNKTVWQDGDIITADKMNNIENGIYSYNEDITNLEAEKADAIIVESAAANSFSASQLENAVSLISNATGFGNVYIAQTEDVLPSIDSINNTTSGITFVKNVDDCFFHASGAVESKTSQKFTFKSNNVVYFPLKKTVLTGDIVTFVVFATGTITGSDAAQPISIITYFKYTDGTSNSYVNKIETGLGFFTFSLIAEKDVATFAIEVSFRQNYTFDIDCYFGAIHESDYTPLSVPESGYVVIQKDDLGDGGYSILPSKAQLVYNVSIEEYVHNYVEDHVPEDMLTYKELKYLSPEMYGAKGDGVTDDSVALQSCLDASVPNNIPVRAYGQYKLTTGISFTTPENYPYADVYINEIEFTGSGSAVTISGQGVKFNANFINAYYATNCDSAIKLAGTSGGSKYCEINVNRIYAYNSAVEYDCTDGSLFYNRFACGRIIARYGNAFLLHKTSDSSNYLINENDFTCKSISCSRGYAVYAPDRCAGVSNFFSRLGMENECANGVYGIITLDSCRTVECMDQKKTDITKGTMIKIPTGCTADMPNAYNTNVDFDAFDITEAMTYEECLDGIIDTYESGQTKAKSFDRWLRGHAAPFVVSDCYRYICANVSGYSDYLCLLVTGKLIGYYNHKGFVPDFPVTKVIAEADFYTHKRTFPTVMIMGVNANIYLDYSYCCVGINEFILKQTSQYKATIYDKDGNLLFNGADHDPGTYKFSCKMVPLDSLTLTLHDQSPLTYGADTVAFLYTGSNEEWTIEKLNIVS